MLCRWLHSLMLTAALGPLPLAAAVPSASTADPPLTIDRAVELARQRAPSGRAAGARLDAATRAAALAGRMPNPSIEIRGENWTTGRWGWTPARTPDGPPGTDFFAVLTQPVELGGRLAIRRSMAAADRDLASAAGSQAMRAIALDTVQLYVQAVRAREVLGVLAENGEGLDAAVRMMRLRVKEGYAAESDLMKFQAERARLDGEVARTRVDLARATALLGALVGEPVGEERLVLPRPAAVPPGGADALVEQAVERLPEVQHARAAAARARSGAALERSARWPEAAVSAGYKRTAGMDTAVAGVVLSLPVFDRNGRAVAVAEGDAHAAALEAQGARVAAAATLSAQLDAARLLAAQADRVGADLLAPAEGVRTAARSSFREGAADVLKLVDAERVYLDARREALELRLGAFEAAVQVRLALGKEIYE